MDGLAPKSTSTNSVPSLTELKLEFEKSSDPHGRITLYSIELL